MLLKKQIFLFLFFSYFVATAQSIQWQPVVEMDNNLYPSYILATANSKVGYQGISQRSSSSSQYTSSRINNNTNANNKHDWLVMLEKLLHQSNTQYANQVVSTTASDIVGDPDGLLGIRINNLAYESRVRIEIAETYINYAASFEANLQSGRNYFVFPKINWKYDRLRQVQQPTPLNFQFKLSVNGTPMGQQLSTISLRSIQECPFYFKNLHDEGHAIHWLFAAYVNEHSPRVDQILKQALDTKIVNSFIGYQGTAQDVTDQVFAVWYTLQNSGIKYSSITNTSLNSDRVAAQRVRLLNQSLQNSQANCVDGSVLFASILKAIDIDPFLVLVPGHMYVGFYTSPQQQNPMVLETTMIGNLSLKNLQFNQVPYNYQQILSEVYAELEKTKQFKFGRTREQKQSQIDKWTAMYSQAWEQAKIATSRNAFFEAMEIAVKDYTKNSSFFDKTPQHQIIRITPLRKFVQPIYTR